MQIIYITLKLLSSTNTHVVKKCVQLLLSCWFCRLCHSLLGNDSEMVTNNDLRHFYLSLMHQHAEKLNI